MAAGLGASFLAAFPVVSAASASTTFSGQTSTSPIPLLPFAGTAQSVCGSRSPGQASCLARVILPKGETSYFSRFSTTARPQRGNASVVTVSGLSPATIETVYGFQTSPLAGSAETIAVVDAYNDPTAVNDLNAFSCQFGLPVPADGVSSTCSTGTGGSFSQVNESGGTSLPGTNSSWALEISLDIEWAHAIAPAAHILLVEANSSSFTDLMKAEQYGASQARYVTNSWGSTEFSGENSYDTDFSAPGVSYFVASGDTGGVVDYPAASPNVIAVGGTSLSFSGNGTFASESAWSGGGGGCSAVEHAPSAQSGFSQYAQTGCNNGGRAVPDVSLDANPSSGVAVYDSTAYSGQSGWWTVGGTSVATPIWAAESADTTGAITSSTIYSSGSIRFRDVTSGSNGFSTLVGFDLATGRGSWATTAPAAPTGLSATAGTGHVSLSWSASAGASTYDVYRGTTSGGESTTPVATGLTSASYADTGVSSGKNYFYEVEAVNTNGFSSPSNEASQSSTGSGPPAAPTNLTATPSSGQVALSWTAVPSTTSYEVLRGTASNSLSSYANPTTNGYTDTGVTAGKTYYYEVEAVNGSLTSSPSNEASALVPSGSSGGGSGGGLVAHISKSCFFRSCTFTSTSTDSVATITAYSWSGGNGVSGSGSSVSHSYTATGSWSVTLTVTDSKGSTASTTVNVSCGGFSSFVTSCN
jgi:subtilase family serine protease